MAPAVRDALLRYPAVALLGPRQVGKTTLARSLDGHAPAHAHAAAPGLRPGVVYLDLENPADLDKLADAPAYLRSFPGQLLILDEIQRLPGLFQILRGIIDERVLGGAPAGHFLLLGSASIDLLRQASETLAGRIAYLELNPLGALEVEERDIPLLWARGGFPPSFLAENDGWSADWRANFITTYLERDIPQLGSRIPAETLRRFWTMLAHAQGTLLNAADLARSLAVDGKTVARYLDLMVDLLLVRRLAPHHIHIGKRLVKSPKVYVRDSGLVHTLLRLDTLDQVLGHPIAGRSWEGFVLETLLAAAPPRATASFYRTVAGTEADLILEIAGNQRWVVEIKRGLVPRLEKGFRNSLEDLQPERAFVVHSGTERYPKGDGIEAISLRGLAAELAALG